MIREISFDRDFPFLIREILEKNEYPPNFRGTCRDVYIIGCYAYKIPKDGGEWQGKEEIKLWKSCQNKNEILCPIVYSDVSSNVVMEKCSHVSNKDLDIIMEKQYEDLYSIYRKYEYGENLSIEDAVIMYNQFGFFSEVRLCSSSIGVDKNGFMKIMDYGECHNSLWYTRFLEK